jgi:AraC family transcriptional regulator
MPCNQPVARGVLPTWAWVRKYMRPDRKSPKMADPTEKLLVVGGTFGETGPLESMPQITSAPLGWRGYCLEQHRVPPFEVQDVFWARDVVFVQQSSAITLEFKNGGHYTPKRILPGQVSLRPSGMRTSARTEDTIEFVSLSLEPSFISEACGKVPDLNRFQLTTQHGIEDPFVEGVCIALRNEVLRGGTSGRLYSESLASSLAVHLATRYGHGSGPFPGDRDPLPPRKIRQAIDHIHHHLHHDLSLKDIAGSVGLSPFHFARLFKRSIGLSPHQYLVRQRVERARQLLLQGDLSLAAIATAVGFCDQSHFTMHFRRIHKVTPKTYADRGDHRNAF